MPSNGLFSLLGNNYVFWETKTNFWSIANILREGKHPREVIQNLKVIRKFNSLGLFFLFVLYSFIFFVGLHAEKTIWYFTSRNGNTRSKSRLKDYSTQRNTFLHSFIFTWRERTSFILNTYKLELCNLLFNKYYGWPQFNYWNIHKLKC